MHGGLPPTKPPPSPKYVLFIFRERQLGFIFLARPPARQLRMSLMQPRLAKELRERPAPRRQLSNATKKSWELSRAGRGTFAQHESGRSGRAEGSFWAAEAHQWVAEKSSKKFFTP